MPLPHSVSPPTCRLEIEVSEGNCRFQEMVEPQAGGGWSQNHYEEGWLYTLTLNYNVSEEETAFVLSSRNVRIVGLNREPPPTNTGLRIGF